MLKIKDNVDLKELEKYGFKRVQCINSIAEDEWDKIELIEDEDGNIKSSKGYSFPYDEVNWVVYKSKTGKYEQFINYIIEFDNTEEKDYEPREIDIDDMEILYDLIKADLVEKVEDNNGK